MNIVICIKEVFNFDDVKINKETKNIDRLGVKMFINPYDLNAIELALNLKDKYNANTYVITMGIPTAEKTLRKCLSMGIDNALLITDIAMVGSDTIATSLVLSEAIIKYIPTFDLILCGKHSIDSETSIIGPAIAKRLGIPQLTYVNKLIDITNENKVIVKKSSENEDIVIEAPLPAVITVTNEINKPRYINLNYIKHALNSKIEIVNSEMLGINKEKIGIPGSPTTLGDMHIIENLIQNCNMLTGDIEDITRKIAKIIKTVK